MHHLSAVVTAQPYCEQPLLLRLPQCRQYIARVAAGRDAHGNVALLPVGNDLAHKDVIESHVVPHGRYHRDVVGQRYCRQRSPVRKWRVEQIDYYVLCICGTSTVSKGQEG